MNIGDLRSKLAYLSHGMKINVIAHNKSFDFSISFGSGSDGGGNNFDTLSFYVDELCQSEKAAQKPSASDNNGSVSCKECIHAVVCGMKEYDFIHNKKGCEHGTTHIP